MPTTNIAYVIEICDDANITDQIFLYIYPAFVGFSMKREKHP